MGRARLNHLCVWLSTHGHLEAHDFLALLRADRSLYRRRHTIRLHIYACSSDVSVKTTGSVKKSVVVEACNLENVSECLTTRRFETRHRVQQGSVYLVHLVYVYVPVVFETGK
jgi:hypothetical protein